MSFDVAQSVQQLFTNFLGGIFSSEQTALQFLQDPNGSLTAAGLDDKDLSNLNVQQAVVDACDYPGVPPSVKENLSSYSAPSYSSAPPTVENVVQQVQQVTQVVYQDNSEVTNFVNNNITDIEVHGDLHGDIDVDNNNANAAEGGVAVAGNDNDVNAATGDGSNLIDNEDGNINGNVNQNSGDGAVQAGDDINAPVNTGTNTGIIADGDVENAVVGDDNQTFQINDVDGDVDLDDNQFNFGDGDNVQQNDNENSAISNNGDAINVQDSNLDGSAVTTGDISAHDSFQDNDQDFTSHVEHADDVTVQQAGGDATQDSNQSEDFSGAL